ncbi:hypothetical protein NC651_039553 [Populus alba x Populus x berolinensis]|nr:hypothetical protein NC651_039553 [Populus alba x Populus x berolinensis]
MAATVNVILKWWDDDGCDSIVVVDHKLCPRSQTGTVGESQTTGLQMVEGKSGDGVFSWKWLFVRAIAKQENNKIPPEKDEVPIYMAISEGQPVLLPVGVNYCCVSVIGRTSPS